eukprot:193757_1
MSSPFFCEPLDNLTPILSFSNSNRHQKALMTEIYNDEGNKMYLREKLLGQGTYGMVYLAQHISTQEMVVIKQMKRFHQDGPGLSPTMLREASILKKLKHQNIVEIKDIFFTYNQEFCLVFELCAMDLHKYIDAQINLNKKIELPLIKKWSYQMISGISYMHSHRIWHRDIKPANILVTDNMNIKIGDLGLGREHEIPIKELTPEIVTLWYRAPELLLGTRLYCGKVDIWSVGLIIAEMARNEPLFAKYCEWELIIAIFKCFGTPTIHDNNSLIHLQHFSCKFPQFNVKGVKFENEMGSLKHDKFACDLLKKMLQVDPEKRLNATKLLKHKWFANVENNEHINENKLTNERINSKWNEYCDLVNTKQDYNVKSTMKISKCKHNKYLGDENDNTLGRDGCNHCITVFDDITYKPNNMLSFGFGSRRILSDSENYSEDIDIQCEINNGLSRKTYDLKEIFYESNKRESKNKNHKNNIDNKNIKRKKKAKRSRKEYDEENNYDEIADIENIRPIKRCRK